MSVPPLENPRVPSGVERQVERVSGKRRRLFPTRGDRAVSQPYGADLLPGDVGIVEVAEGRFESGNLWPVRSPTADPPPVQRSTCMAE